MSALSGDRPIDLIAGDLAKFRPTGDSTWSACCPAHGDSNPSLSVKEFDDGGVSLHCHRGCTRAEILASLGRVEAEMHIRSKEWTHSSITAVRVHDWGHSRHIKTSTGWIWQHDNPVTGKVEHTRAPDAEYCLWLADQLRVVEVGSRVLATEGEKDAQKAADIGLLATTAEHWNMWGSTDLTPLHSLKVAVIGDRDEQGFKYARTRTKALTDAGIEVVGSWWPVKRFGPKADLADVISLHLNEGLTGPELHAAVKADLEPIPSELPDDMAPQTVLERLSKIYNDKPVYSIIPGDVIAATMDEPRVLQTYVIADCLAGASGTAKMTAKTLAAATGEHEATAKKRIRAARDLGILDGTHGTYQVINGGRG